MFNLSEKQNKLVKFLLSLATYFLISGIFFDADLDMILFATGLICGAVMWEVL